MMAGEVGDLTKFLLEAPAYVIGVFFLILLSLAWVNQGFSRLVEPLYFWRNRRRELLDAYLAANGNNGTAPEMLSLMADMRDALYFYEATGIDADKKWRLLLVKLNQQTAPDISWRTIRRAQEYLVPDGAGGVAVIPFPVRDWLMSWLAVLLTICFFIVFSVLVFALQAALLGEFDHYKEIIYVAPMWFLAGMMVVRMYIPYLAARKIRKELASPAP